MEGELIENHPGPLPGLALPEGTAGLRQEQGGEEKREQ